MQLKLTEIIASEFVCAIRLGRYRVINSVLAASQVETTNGNGSCVYSWHCFVVKVWHRRWILPGEVINWVISGELVCNCARFYVQVTHSTNWRAVCDHLELFKVTTAPTVLIIGRRTATEGEEEVIPDLVELVCSGLCEYKTDNIDLWTERIAASSSKRWESIYF